ncbi:hydroxymethylbilane synthase [Ignavigranum ruoffiae]|uniref:Multifunctional fusion protein n=1 Tax=Ignavigranum ruoffiae TaxID=89093 RepID=A0A1H9CG01_9LACT|nr:hydroxymethylbilane synthase [Ignavigranum ruoffiae]SEQ00160.1 hydroxymethylbilane synthase/glutamyl-tRNA reductase,TIGR01035 [Ignavigranum ruoffiae]
MNIVYVGITHQKTPIEIREKLSFANEELKKAGLALQAEKSILENVIISTCNRTELYVLCDQIHTGQYYAKHFLANWFGLNFDTLKPYIEIKKAEEAIRHLLLLSCGMKSKIFGESQILGQIRRAYEIALNNGTTGLYLNKLFQIAQRFGKKQQTTYKLSQRPRSISFQTMRIIQKDKSLAEKSLLIIGLGEIGQLVLKHAIAQKFEKIYIMNRTFKKAVQFSQKYGELVCAKPISEIEKYINKCDYIITAVASSKPIINGNLLSGQKFQTFFDLGLPRNMSNIKTHKKIKYYNIDDINLLLEKNYAEQKAVYSSIKEDADQEVIDFYKWEASLDVLPTIEALRNKMLSHYEQVESSLDRKIDSLSSHDRKVIRKHLKSLVNAMLKEPIKVIKELNYDTYGQYKLDFVRELFQLDMDLNIKNTNGIEQRIVKIGTRGSKLALIQTESVIEKLKVIYPHIRFEKIIISTKGDVDRTSSLKVIGGKGVFIKEIEKELINKNIDIAIHSLKDVPSQLVPGTVIASTPKRFTTSECIIMKDYQKFNQLPHGAKIGTGSQRRVYQLKKIRPDLNFVDIRGNIETRINKLYTDNLDGVVLAVAGLERLGFFDNNDNLFVDYFSDEEIIPAVGQGAIAIQCRSDDFSLIEMVRAINHELTEACVKTERDYLGQMGLGCNFPIGAHATMNSAGNIILRGMLADNKSNKIIVEKVTSQNQDYKYLGKELFDKIMSNGGRKILADYLQEMDAEHENS